MAERTIWSGPMAVAEVASITWSTTSVMVPPMEREPSTMVHSTSTPASVLPVVCRLLKSYV